MAWSNADQQAIKDGIHGQTYLRNWLESQGITGGLIADQLGEGGQAYRLSDEAQKLLSDKGISKFSINPNAQKGQTGGLRLMDASGNVVEETTYDEGKGLGATLAEAAAAGALAFGGLGLAGAGPLAGLFGGAAPTAAASGAAPGTAAGVMEGGGLINSAFANAASAAGSLAPEGVAALIPTGLQLSGGGLLAGGLLGGGAGAPAASGATSSLINGLKKAGGGAINFAKSNPKLAGSIAGGLLGGAGGEGGGSPAYGGPMPEISRGDWSPTAQPTMMQVPQFGGGLLNTQGNANSGLWRYRK